MYHPKIAKTFGNDLSLLLGPPADRIPWNSLSSKEQQRRIAAIPEYINTRQLGKFPSLVDIVGFCFNRLSTMGDGNPLRGIDLPCHGNLASACSIMKVPEMNYATALEPVENLHKNADKQRDVWLRHIFKDIVLRFNPALIYPAIGRKDPKTGRIFANDGQHRTLACIILGIDAVPVNYIVSGDEYWDVAQYASINIDALTASEYDQYRIKVQRYAAAVNAGRGVEPGDEVCHEMHLLFENLGITVAEKRDNMRGHSLLLTSIGNMLKYRMEYGEDLFRRAVEINARMFPTSKVHTANCWGLMEFLSVQDPSVPANVIDDAIFRAIKRRWKNNNSGGNLHRDIKTAYNQQTSASATNSRVPEEVIIAEGIRQVCEKYESGVQWKAPVWTPGAATFKLALV